MAQKRAAGFAIRNPKSSVRLGAAFNCVFPAVSLLAEMVNEPVASERCHPLERARFFE